MYTNNILQHSLSFWSIKWKVLYITNPIKFNKLFSFVICIPRILICGAISITTWHYNMEHLTFWHTQNKIEQNNFICTFESSSAYLMSYYYVTICFITSFGNRSIIIRGLYKCCNIYFMFVLTNSKFTFVDFNFPIFKFVLPSILWWLLYTSSLLYRNCLYMKMKGVHVGHFYWMPMTYLFILT